MTSAFFWPSLEVQADAAALVAAFGTPEVEEKSEAWQSVVRQMITAAEQVVWEEAHPSQVPPQGKSARATIYELRPEELRRRRELAAQVRAELGFGYRSTRAACPPTKPIWQRLRVGGRFGRARLERFAEPDSGDCL